MKNMKREDDRTPEQKKTHTILITATDKFLSGWGGASGGAFKCAWACKPSQDWGKVFEWAKNRPDMKYVDIKFNNKWYPQAAHVHIYVVDDTHPALK